ncbi:MAG: thioredoxin domain-containing protein [Nannocystaceae bacterium]
MSDNRSRPWLALLFVALLGVADGVYLTLVHLDYEVGRAGLASACHRFSSTGCSVTAGRYGDFAGVPVATLGLGGALAIAVLAVLGWRRASRWEDPMRAGVVVLAGLAVVASVTMAVFSTLEGAWCPFCVAWYGINLAQALLAWRCRDTHLGVRDIIDDALGLPSLLAAVVFGASVTGTMLWYGARKLELEAERDAAIIPALVAELRASPPQRVGVPDAPRKGPADAEIVIVEFGDFECPHCRKLYEAVEATIASSPRRIAVEFAHFPLDSSCNPKVDRRHPHACGAAIAAECARRQGKFWELAAELFAHQDALEREALREYAGGIGLDVDAFDRCMVDPEVAARVTADAELGLALGITGTPTFFVNGYKWTGAMPAAVLAGVIEGLLAPPQSPAQ